jgi:PAS domain S-box-containing protein
MKRPAPSRCQFSRLAVRLAFLPSLATLPGTALVLHAYSVNWPKGVLIGCLGVATLPPLAMWLSVQRLLARPLRLVRRVISTLAEGDFSGRSRPRSRNELGLILRALDDLAGRLEANFAATRASERRYRLLFEHNPAGMLRTRADDGRILDCNPAAVRLLGYGSGVEAKTYRAEGCYANPADRKMLIDRLRNGEVIESQEVLFRRKDGRDIPVLLSLCRVDEGGTMYLEGQFVDISHRTSVNAA